MRVGFAGTPDFAVPSLQALLDSSHQVVGVWTQPDRPAGRGKKLQASAVKHLALEAGIAVHQPASLRADEAQQVLKEAQLDCLIVAAYGLLLPKAVLDIPRYGCVNVHGSLLPRWRGAAPVQAAILADDAMTGVTIMQMAEGLDTGDMLLKAEVVMAADVTAGELTEQLAQAGAQALVQACDDLPALQQAAQVQDESLANYAHKINKGQAVIDWSQSAQQIDRQVRAYSPWPVAYTMLEEQRLRVWQGHCVSESTVSAPGTILEASPECLLVATGDGCYAITQLQMPNKRRSGVGDFLNANQALKQGAQQRLG